MKIFLAGTWSLPSYKHELTKKLKYALESFYYIRQWQIEYIDNHWEMFLLDSGAFSFLSDPKKIVNLEKYINDYIAFINKYDIKYFFELDIDALVGIDKVEKIRYKLERETGKKCIPVFHKSRGKQYWLDMIKNYDYVAIGGFAMKDIKPSEYKYIDWFLNAARKESCKVHGLGFTGLKLLKRYSFYSVDSTSWTSCMRYGTIYIFKDNKLIDIEHPTKKRKAEKNSESLNITLDAWIKFQQYHDGRIL